jgi:arsenite methyltransferase
MELWAGCIAGALEEGTYRQLLADAGFTQIDVEVTRVYQPEDLQGSECCGQTTAGNSFAELAASGGRLVSAFVRARKPVQPDASVEAMMNTPINENRPALT